MLVKDELTGGLQVVAIVVHYSKIYLRVLRKALKL
jgi:hypothetical protein